MIDDDRIWWICVALFGAVVIADILRGILS